MNIGFKPDNSPKPKYDKDTPREPIGFKLSGTQESLPIPELKNKEEVLNNTEKLRKEYDFVVSELDKLFDTDNFDHIDTATYQNLLARKLQLASKLGIKE